MAQFDKTDRFLIIDKTTGTEIETQPTLGRAQHAVNILNNREKSFKRTQHSFIYIDRHAGPT